MRRPLGVLLVCLAVAACGAEEDVPEPAAPRRARWRPPLADVLEVRCLADGTTAVATPQVRPGSCRRAHAGDQRDGRRPRGLARRRPPLHHGEPGRRHDRRVVRGPAARQGRPRVHRARHRRAAGDVGRPRPRRGRGRRRALAAHRGRVPAGRRDGDRAPRTAGPRPGLTREQLPDELRTRTRLASDDEIRRGGYPEQDNAPLVVIRDGRVVISATPEGAGRRLGPRGGAGLQSDGLLEPEAAADVPPEDVESAAAEATRR